MMVTVLEDIQKILNLAVWAPSGDNAQPWKFEIENNEIHVFNVPEKDTSLYNYHQSASLIANGCLVENIKIVATHYGYGTKIKIFPRGDKQDLVATVILDVSQSKDDSLYPYIQERATNRKPYKPQPISNADKEQISAEAGKIEGVQVKIVEDRKAINTLAQATSVNEKIVLENQNLHQFLFDHITWSEDEDKIRAGFFIKTLELQGPQKLAFRLFSHWPILKLFNKIGISDFVAKENARLYTQSGAFVAILTLTTSPVDFVKSGMVTQRIWLKATRLNLGVQPLVGILFLNHRIDAGDPATLSAKHIGLARDSYRQIANTFGISNQVITMLFRIGIADPPSARTRRLPPAIKVIN